MIRSDVLGIVLTGGRSSRMGRDKAALPHPDGGSFADHAIDRLQNVCRHVAIAGCAPQPSGRPFRDSVRVIPDPAAHLGPVTGIVAAMRRCRELGASAVLVTPVDMPHLTCDDLRGLLDTWESACGEHSLQPVVATFDSVHCEPLVAVYPVALLGSLEQLAASHDRSLNRWLRLQPHRLQQLSPEGAANINTPRQYRKLAPETDAGQPLSRPRKQPDR